MANLLFTLAPDVSFQRGFLVYLKKREKVPFLWSTIYSANFDTFNGLLELVPSGISAFLVFSVFLTFDETISY